MSDEKIDRIGAMLNEKDFDFVKTQNEDGTLFKYQAGLYAMPNDVEKAFNEYERKYIENERFAYDLFVQLTDLLKELEMETKDNYWYENMDIVRLFKEILIRYNNWSSAMRRNTLMSQETMKTMFDMLKNRYIPAEEVEKIKLEEVESFMKRRVLIKPLLQLKKNEDFILHIKKSEAERMGFARGDKISVLRKAEVSQ
jgi:hypothetical protein